VVNRIKGKPEPVTICDRFKNLNSMQKKPIKSDYEILIFTFRGMKVMIDADLALLYDVPTKRLKEQVKRNIGRFPSDLMFELTTMEKDELVANCDRLSGLKHSNVNPLAFTEQGVAMLSSVLRSAKAIQINIEIMRAFARYRALLKETEEMKQKITDLDHKLTEMFQYLLDRIDELHQQKNEPREPVGFKINK